MVLLINWRVLYCYQNKHQLYMTQWPNSVNNLINDFHCYLMSTCTKMGSYLYRCKYREHSLTIYMYSITYVINTLVYGPTDPPLLIETSASDFFHSNFVAIKGFSDKLRKTYLWSPFPYLLFCFTRTSFIINCMYTLFIFYG